MELKIKNFDRWKDLSFAYSLIKNPRLQKWTRPRSIINVVQHFEDLKSDKYTLFYGGERAGLVRYYRGEISILINPDYQGKGLGTLALNHLKTTHNRILANIDRGNVESIKFFEKNGFKFKETDHMDITLEFVQKRKVCKLDSCETFI